MLMPVLPAILGTSLDKPVRLEPFTPLRDALPDYRMARLRAQEAFALCRFCRRPSAVRSAHG